MSMGLKRKCSSQAGGWSEFAWGHLLTAPYSVLQRLTRVENFLGLIRGLIVFADHIRFGVTLLPRSTPWTSTTRPGNRPRSWSSGVSRSRTRTWTVSSNCQRQPGSEELWVNYITDTIIWGQLKRADSTLDINYVIGSFSWSFEDLITYVNVAKT